MPCDKVRCPLCSEEVSRNKFGGHLMSRKHHDAIKVANASTLEKWGKTADYLKALPKFPNWPDLPLVKTKGSNDFYCCFGCKTAWVNHPYNHLSASKSCIPGHAKALHYLSGVVSEEDRVKSLENEIAELKRQLADTTSGKVVFSSEDYVPKEKHDEVVSERDELEKSNDEYMASNLFYRGILKKVFGDRFPKGIYGEAEKELLEELVSAPEPPKPAPEPPKPKFNEARVAAFVAANINHDKDGMCSLGALLTNEEATEASKRLTEHYSKPKPALVPAPNPPPASSAAFQPPPINPPVLTSTRTRIPGKMLYREKLALQQTN